MKNSKFMERNNLIKYVSESDPEVNVLLRNGKDASAYTFDSLFEMGAIPQPLYRLINNEHFQVQDNTFIDQAYLSCTRDVDAFINHVQGENLACLHFDIYDELPMIDVHTILKDHNDENEVVLPRGLRFKVELVKIHSSSDDIQEFLDIVNSNYSVKEIRDIYKIINIFYYKLTL